MKKLRVTINGISYDVEVEVLEDDDDPGAGYGYGATNLPTTSIAPPAVAPPASSAAPKPVAPPRAPSGAAGANTLTSPIAGVVKDIRVKVGDSVKENDPVIIIEAMKMETVVSSPVSGVIEAIQVENGQSVQQGNVLVTFR